MGNDFEPCGGGGSSGPLPFKYKRGIVMNANRENLIKRLVERRMAATLKARISCSFVARCTRNKTAGGAVVSPSSDPGAR
jgi:hypothetical protein